MDTGPTFGAAPGPLSPDSRLGIWGLAKSIEDLGGLRLNHARILLALPQGGLKRPEAGFGLKKGLGEGGRGRLSTDSAHSQRPGNPVGCLYPKSYVLWEPSDLRDTQGQVPIRGFPRITLAWSGMAVSQSWKRGKQ